MPNGDRIIVEIDESHFFKRKYNRGRMLGNHWVFGGIQRNSGECFLVEVPDRTRQTLETEIQQYIAPGTRIIHDGWASYAEIHNIPGQDYDHDTIIHDTNFVDPADPEIHTQNIENCWGRVKRTLRAQCGTSQAQFHSQLHEFMFRNKHRVAKHNMLSAFILAVSDNYGIQ